MSSVGADDLAILGMQSARHNRTAATRKTNGHHHRLSRPRRAVVHRSISEVHAREFRDHGLKFENCLQRTLRKLSLVRRIGSQELAALHERIDDYGTVMSI